MLDKHSTYEDLKQDVADIVNQIQQNGEHTVKEMVALNLDEQSKQTTLAQMQLAGSDCNQYLASGLEGSRFIVDGTATEVYDTVTGKWLSIDQDMYAKGQLGVTGVATGMTDTRYILDEANGEQSRINCILLLSTEQYFK